MLIFTNKKQSPLMLKVSVFSHVRDIVSHIFVGKKW